MLTSVTDGRTDRQTDYRNSAV